MRWLLVRGVVLVIAVTVLQVLFVRFVTPPATPLMVARAVESGAWVEHRPRPYGPDHPAARAVVASEDARFFLHRGFDWDALCGALEEARDGRRLRGASTLSQQVARNLFLWQGRSWIRKALEAWYTAWLELLVPKGRILELYLNIAETGPLVFGFEAGAAHWYGVGADDLSPGQAARLAGILPSPRQWRPDGRAASRRVRFLETHPAPFPGDPGFDLATEAWGQTRGLAGCWAGG